MVKVDEPEPGAVIEAGLKLALAPAGKPEAESEIEELKFPERVETIVTDPALPRAIVNDDADDDSEKLGPKLRSMTGCSSMPLGAMPSWPANKSKNPTPVICTGTLASWKLVVAVNIASNCARACAMPAAKGLPGPTQPGAGISAIIVLPALSVSTMW